MHSEMMGGRSRGRTELPRSVRYFSRIPFCLKSHSICGGMTPLDMPEMEHNGIWNDPQDDPRLSSAPVRFNSVAFADIPTRANDCPSSRCSSGFQTSFAANPGTSNSSYMNSTSNGSFRNFPPNQAPNWPSCYNHPVRGDGHTLISPQMDYRRVAFKRKSPVMPLIADRANATGYYQAGSSLNCPSYSASLEPKVIPSPECWPLDTINMPASYRNDNNIAEEGWQRNVRSRHSEGFRSQFSPPWFYASRNMPYTFCSTCNTSDPRMTEQWNHVPAPMVPQGQVPNSDASSFNHELDRPTARGNINGGTNDSNSAYFFRFNQNRNQSAPLPALQYPSIRGGMMPVQSGHDQMAIPRRTISSYLDTGVSISSDNGVPVGVEAAASSRHSRPLPIMGRTSHGENHSARDVHQGSSIFNEHSACSRWIPEGVLMIHWSAFSDSVNLFDQHRDMRMDIDNMSYEELLALEERIGNVSTGLSGETVSRCMMETVYHSSHQIQEERNCVICLEEYKNSEKLGRLNCGHDFHVCCISQWLQIKNVCPICKESAFTDTSKKQRLLCK